MDYYAHISDDGRRQMIAEHLAGTAALCRSFAGEFGAEAEGELMGLAHDIGKCTDGFQKRLLEGGPIVDHATAGALLTARDIPTLDEDSAILADLTLYDERTGLALEPETGRADFI